MTHKNSLYLERKKYFLLIIIVLVGSVNYGITGITNINLINKLEIIHSFLPTMIYLLIGLSAIFLISSKKTFLPYIGDSTHPCDKIKDHIPNNYTDEYKLKVPPNVLVIYWGNDIDNLELKNDLEIWNSFKNYSNTGAIRANEYGNVILKLKQIKNRKKKYIYYKYFDNVGFLSSLKKIYVK
jgi:uncharacterized membrane protein YuzA (DUF378 family)